MTVIISAPISNPTVRTIPPILVGEIKCYPPDLTVTIRDLSPVTVFVSYPVVSISMFEVGKKIDVLIKNSLTSSLKELKYIRPKWPLYSLDAVGKFPAAGVFFRRMNGKTVICKLGNYPHTRTPRQATRRNRFAQAVKAWQALDIPTKKLWHFDCWPHGKRMSGYNWFISNFMRETGYWPK